MEKNVAWFKRFHFLDETLPNAMAKPHFCLQIYLEIIILQNHFEGKFGFFYSLYYLLSKFLPAWTGRSKRTLQARILLELLPDEAFPGPSSLVSSSSDHFLSLAHILIHSYIDMHMLMFAHFD